MKLTTTELKNLIGVIFAPPCYNEPRKSFLIRFIENIRWYFYEGRVNRFYNIYGCDLVKKDTFLYIGEKNHFDDIKKLENKLRYNSVLKILSDKYEFYLFCLKNKLPHPKIFKYYDGEKINELIAFNRNNFFDNENVMFLKETQGSCGIGVKCIKSNEMLKNIEKSFGKHKYILQEGVFNHKDLDNLYSKSLNTIRCVTISDGETVKVFSSIFRCGTSTSKNVDNISAGGLSIGIDESGKLMKYGHSMKHMKVYETHPDTGVKFRGLQLPFYQDAIDIALKAHEKIKLIPSIGWDIAITPNGVVLIEGNEFWEISVIQCCYGGLKEDWKNFFNDRLKMN